MNLKKIIASIAAASIAVTSMATISASAVTAGATSIDFEDGDCSFVYMNVDDDGSDSSILSVEDYNGSKALRVDVQDKSKTPKVWFDLDKMLDRSNTIQIRTIKFDLTLVPKTAEGTIGWAGGAVGVAGGFDINLPGKGQVNPSWTDKAWDGGAYDPGAAAEVKIERKFLMGNECYTEAGVNPFFGLMRWAAGEDADNYYMYIDNIEFLDKDGKNLTVGVTPAEEPAEEAATEEATTEAPAEEAATEEAPAEEAVEEEVAVEEPEAEVAPAPEADTTTAPVATGNAAVASIAAVMAIAGAAAIASKKRN